ncbi:piggyBac transposable element-derived protein 3-like [Schistocerca piceifrons]|uniref:piggyBac transposable element-derived protein 3-like n=1 Tax=Schistocerca piceifrons TaxID=274613 RepID=UPI001F5EE601|nr:piggyBac transposable element-derived protein 3-like [Schistocerca piceifrons]
MKLNNFLVVKTANQIPAVADIMSCSRWEQLKLGLHFSDNENIDPADKLHKIRPFLESLVGNFQSIPMSEKLSVDEQMIPFKGKHSLKNYVKKIYTGNVKHDPSLPDVSVSGNVLRLASVIYRHMFHKLYFRNWFTRVRLVVELEKMGIQSLGTVRRNWLKGCTFTSDKEMKKGSRGS